MYKAEIPAGQDSVDVSVAPTGPGGGFVDVGLCPDAGYYCSSSYSSAHVGIVGNSNYPLPFSSDIFVFTPDGNYVGAALTAGECAPMAVGISGTGTTTLTFDPTCFEVTYADGTVIEPNQPLNSSGGPFLMLDLWGVGQTIPGDPTCRSNIPHPATPLRALARSSSRSGTRRSLWLGLPPWAP